MLVDLVLLRTDGLRLRTPELAPPVRGELELAHVDGRTTSFKRPTTVAHLYASQGVQQHRQDLVRPLFDARVVAIEGDLITLAGIELTPSADTTRTYAHEQVWRCTVVTPG